MMRVSFSQLHIQLVFLVLFIFLPPLGLILYTAYEQQQMEARNAQVEAMHLLQNASLNQEKLIEGTQQFLTFMAQLPEVRGGDSAACGVLFSDLLKRQKSYTNFGLINLDGDLLCTAIPTNSPVNFSENLSFQSALKTRDFSTGNYELGPISGKPSIPFSYPVLSQTGQIQSVVFASLDLTWFNKLAVEMKLPTGATFTMVDRNGIILSRYPDPEKWVGKMMPETPIIRTVLEQKGEGTTESTGIDGTSRLYAYMPLYGTNEIKDIYIYTGIPTDVVFGGVNRLKIRNLTLLLLVTIIIITISWFGGYLFFIRHIEALLNATKRLTSGDFSARTGLSHGPGEFGQLAKAFDHMAQSLENYTAEIKSLSSQNKLILSSAGEGIFGLNMHGKTTFSNPAAAKILGYEVEELFNQPSHNIWHHTKPDGSPYPEEECPVYASYKDGTVHHIVDDLFWKKDGTCIPVEYVSTPIRERGELVGAVVVFSDISERKQVEKTLRESEDKYRAIFENTGTAMAIFEEDTTISLANSEFEKISGYLKKEIEGKKSWTEFFHQDDLEIMKKYHYSRRINPDASPRNYECKFIDRQANVRNIYITVALILGTKKSVASLLDITERKLAEDRIRREASRTKTLAEVSQMLVEVSQKLVEAGMEYEAVLNTVTRRITELTGDACFISLLSEDGQWLNTVALHHPNPEANALVMDLLAISPHSADEGPISRAMQTGQTLILPVITVETEYRPYLERLGVHSMLITPLRVQGSVIGTLSVFRDNPGHPFTANDQIFLQDLANRVALAIANARLFNENLRQLKSLHALFDSAQKLGQSLDLQELSGDIVRTCVETFGTRLAWLGQTEPDGRITLLRHFPPESQFPHQITVRWDESPQGLGVVGRAIRNGLPVVINDIHSDPTSIPWREAMLGEGFCSRAAFPLISRDRSFGSLNLYSDKPDFFTPKGIKLFQAFTHQAAAALENARLFKETERRFEHLQALRNIDMAITASLDLRVTFNVVLDQVIDQLNIHAADILLLNHTQTLEYAAGRGFRFKNIERSRLRLDEGYVGRAVFEQRNIMFSNLKEVGQDFLLSRLLADENFAAYFGVPLIAKGQVKGLLEIFHRDPLDPDQEWLDFLETLARQTAIAIDNASLFNAMQRSNIELTMAYDATIEGWSRALDMRDKETEGHSRRVTEMTISLSRAVGMDDAGLVHVRQGALLHDIGKMGIPDNILLKPSPLSEEEWMIMRLHPVYAFEMLSPITYLRQALDIPYCHHEKWDGTGYPRGLKGEQIPLAARIFAVVDVWDALRSDRPYRPAWSEDKVRKHIFSQAATHFDPKVVKLFLEME